jgi:hypothetical protein
VPARLGRAICDDRWRHSRGWALVDNHPVLSGNNADRIQWTVTLHAAWIKRVTSGFHISVALFGQKLLDSLPIIFRKPSVYNQFNHLHKENVPILSA